MTRIIRIQLPIWSLNSAIFLSLLFREDSAAPNSSIRDRLSIEICRFFHRPSFCTISLSHSIYIYIYRRASSERSYLISRASLILEKWEIPAEGHLFTGTGIFRLSVLSLSLSLSLPLLLPSATDCEMKFYIKLRLLSLSVFSLSRVSSRLHPPLPLFFSSHPLMYLRTDRSLCRRLHIYWHRRPSRQDIIYISYGTKREREREGERIFEIFSRMVPFFLFFFFFKRMEVKLFGILKCRHRYATIKICWRHRNGIGGGEKVFVGIRH